MFFQSLPLTIENPMNIEMTNIKNDDDNQVSKDDDEDDNIHEDMLGKPTMEVILNPGDLLCNR